MHWVEQYAQSGFADRVGIEHAEYIVEELVEGILYVGYLPCRDRFIEFKRFYLGQIAIISSSCAVVSAERRVPL